MHNLTLPRLTAALAAASLLSALASCHAPIHTYALGIAVLWVRLLIPCAAPLEASGCGF